MKVARLNLLLLALATTIVLAIAPSSASAIGPGDVVPKPTVTGLPAATNLPAVTFTITTTVPSSWFVDFACAYDAAFSTCDTVVYPSCTPAAGGQKTCSQTVARMVIPGFHRFRFRAEYCDDATLNECETNENFYLSAVETVTFLVDRTNPIVTITSGPDRSRRQIIKPDGGSFLFASNESGAFTCWVDQSPMLPCTAPLKAPQHLKNGLHTFYVIATDRAGNQGSASRQFRVDRFYRKKCKKGSSKRAKAKRKKCVANNIAAKKAWMKKHKLR